MASTRPSLELAGSLPLNGDKTLDVQAAERVLNTQPRPSPTREGEEQALESHEVIELQAFIDRKEWIEEKIKIMEKMPPIEVFAGLDAVRSSSIEVPGLPSREELKQWLVDHDAIEKETEVFDSGEMKKLKKFTKAAAQRNLSPEDTDLIEITLTTIFDLDRLLHLLRDRSEHLDLLEIRITWEECRAAAWSEKQNILQSVQTFLDTRAKWSTSVYETLNASEDQSFHPIIRRGSVASISSAASVSSESSVNSVGFSRGARFKLSEQLTREASHFNARISALRHGKIAAAGKALDKLIDSSRRPVPDELLDEQDRLEEKALNDLEQVGKFALNVVAQWRKADELYVETMKDKASAQTLIEEVETAKLHLPNAAQSLSFETRIDKLKRRIALRDAPDSPKSTFPCPVNPLLSGQKVYNEFLVQTISQDVHSVSELVRSANSLVREYSTKAQVVGQAEALVKASEDCRTSLATIINQLQHGIPASGDDGTFPSLSSKASLQPASHSAFLALLPSLLEQLDQGLGRTSRILDDWSILSIQLDRHGINSGFKTSVADRLQELSNLRERGRTAGTKADETVRRLRQVRQVCSAMASLLNSLEALQHQVIQDIEEHKWRRLNVHEAPITPPTPTNAPLTPMSPSNFADQVKDARERHAAEVEIPLRSLSSCLAGSLFEHVNSEVQRIQKLLNNTSQLIALSENVESQATAMRSIRDEADSILLQIEELSTQQTARILHILEETPSQETASDNELEKIISLLEDRLGLFEESLATRVPFVSQRSSADMLAFDSSALDAAVRADCNSYAMRLSGSMESFRQKGIQVDLARMARDVDAALAVISNDINTLTQELSRLKGSLPPNPPDANTIASLQDLIHQVDAISQDKPSSISRSFSPIQELLHQIDSTPAIRDPVVYQKIYLSRRRAVDDAELRFTSWKEGVETFRQTLLRTQAVEAKRLDLERLEQSRQEKERLERLRLAEDSRLQAEREKASTEATEKKRLRREKQEEEERLQLAEARRVLQLERERFAADSVKNHFLEQQHLATIERLQLEEARLRDEHARQVAEGRLAVEQVEQHRLEHERKVSDQIRKIEAELQAEEGRLRSEKARIAEEMAQLQQEKGKPQRSSPQDNHSDDVFGSSAVGQKPSAEDNILQLKISNLRKRLRSLSIGKIAFPSSDTAALPSSDLIKKLNKDFSSICQEAEQLPDSVDNPSVNLDLISLKADIVATTELMQKVQHLNSLVSIIQKCDTTLSDLLEHVDSYPAPPLGILASDYRPPMGIPPEAQLNARLSFTRTVVGSLDDAIQSVGRDPRASAEQQRVMQTWNELEEMAKDRLQGRKSRPPSVASVTQGSSGRDSRSSASTLAQSKPSRKPGSYAGLSAGAGPSKGRFLSPALPSTRRAVSGGSSDSISRSSSRLSSVSTNRSVSGTHSSLYAPTFASRQRTNSLSTSTTTPTNRSTGITQRVRAQTGQTSRTASPFISELSQSVRTSRGGIGTWSRAPRLSLSKTPTPQPKKPTPGPKKAYIPDPKSKLDVAIGDVVNNLPVNISIEGVAETWKDQSGKYWIGDQDPKLCFCRILRSHTVMVRVGGGWAELSKFIRDHCAESFRLMPESPPRPGAGEERWINSASLLEAAEVTSPPLPPRTPEPRFPFVPTFALSTPTSKSPQSVKSSPSTKGSPLTPLQFIRRAEPDAPLLRPMTPSKLSSLSSSRAKRSMPPTPARHAVWRP
ncbi:hypothetical protein BDN71DRAFT_1454139 [Pleurotus eryngii]|uniref:GAR domain-containing protein n=1 Tax=Pleurotus eryngii TaxID=5323 RepID=A0A9P5ZRK2_PLEER|nr:hypothetical protein BDN71DRAFT_1454139 [Pleurotus eryngii]